MMSQSICQRTIVASLCLLILTSCHKATESTNRVCLGGRCFEVELARKPKDMIRGLQFRTSLGGNEGMLFIFPTEGVHEFWMKDTLIPLDMVWLDKNKRVIEVVRDRPPCLKEPCPVFGPRAYSKYVLEVNAGTMQPLGVESGDQAVFHLKDGE
ncbi:MAG: DUF192 domain-containing protein [Candidatus Omnitrophota bacterium]